VQRYRKYDLEITPEEAERSADALLLLVRILVDWDKRETERDTNRENDSR